MENAVIRCLSIDGSQHETVQHDFPQVESAVAALNNHHEVPMPRLATVARKGRGGTVRPLRARDLRQTRVLMQALCEMRLGLGNGEGRWEASTLASRRMSTMALWRNRARHLFTEAEWESGIEARLDAGFRQAANGCTREAANEFKRAYYLLCCVLTQARDLARRGDAPDRPDAPQPAKSPRPYSPRPDAPRPDAPLDRGA